MFPTYLRNPQFYSQLTVTQPSSINRKTHSCVPHTSPRPGAPEFSHHHPSTRHHLLDSLIWLLINQNVRIAPSSYQKQIRCFDRWKQFLKEMGIDDEWCDEYSQKQRTQLLFAFANSCRRNKHGWTIKTVLTGVTVSSTIVNIHLTFRSNLRPDLAINPNSKPSLFML